ncbi:MAG: beta-lactamase family protein, partial [Saprospiraceae bacterium]|nr:beta-lactamase family protein [Saprospiraceae bacterium]
MRKVFVVCLFSITPFISSFSQSQSDILRPPIYSLTQDEMVSWMDSTTTFWMDSVDIPGMVVSIVAGDSIVMQKGYGYINKEKTAQVDASTSPFRIASISKTFTALAVLQLVSEGKLDLNTDVREYISFEIDRYHNGEITLHHLLTHSAGLDDKILGGGTLNKSEVPKLDQFLASSMSPQIREPGLTFSYSNMGYTLAGYLAELESGIPFYEYVNQLILNPLNMKHTFFWRGDEPIYSESKSYFLDDKGFREYPPYEILSYPSGSIISTGEDISKYMLMILNDGSYNGKQIVTPEVIDLFTQPVFTQDERLPGVRSYGFFNWNINGVNFINHGGSIEGYRSQLYLFPDNNVGLFIATNSSWGGWINSEIG